MLQIFVYPNLGLPCSSLIRRKTDWSASKKKTKVVPLRDKKIKNTQRKVLAGLKWAKKFFKFLKFVKMLKKNLVSFEPITFTLKLTLFLPKTNSPFNRFFFKIDSTGCHTVRKIPDMYGIWYKILKCPEF